MRFAMAPAPESPGMSGTGALLPNASPFKMMTDAAERTSSKGFDVNIAKKVAISLGGASEDLVQLVIDSWQLERSSPISSTDELLTVVEDIAKIPQKQMELKVKLDQFLAKEKEVEHANLKAQVDEHVPNVQGKDICANSESTRTSAVMLGSVESPGKAVKDQSPKDTLEELIRQNRELKKRRMCRGCKKVDLATSGVTFLPCGHFITCEKCSEEYDDCPCCGKSIMGTVRTYLS